MNPESPTAYQEIEENSLLDMQVCAAYKPEDYRIRDDCAARSNGWGCTRPIGHDGPHVAHRSEQSATAWWPNRLSEHREGAGR